MAPKLIFRQLFEKHSHTYTYLLADSITKEAILIDPVAETVKRDIEQIESLGLTLKYGVNTHCHADHITGTWKLKKHFPECKSVIAKASGAQADWHIDENDKITFGHFSLDIFPTPGHTDGCVTYYLKESGMAFTGDALLIRGCGRTDFQQGDPGKLFENVWKYILSLPDETLLYPAHDYQGRSVTTVCEEKRLNPRLTKPKGEFIEIMNNLNLPYPKQIDHALPANLLCGAYEIIEEQQHHHGHKEEEKK